jgi:hypothetical protein
MTEDELLKLCDEQIAMGMDYPHVGLLQQGKWGKRNYRVLFGVKGEIVRDNFDGRGIYVMYPAKELKAAVLRIKQEVNKTKVDFKEYFRI